MLQRGDLVPHFEVTDVRLGHVRYKTFWQRRNLVLVSLPDGPSATVQAYENTLMARHAELETYEAAVVITHDQVAGLTPPAVLIADRWGEVVDVVSGDVAGLPDPGDIVEWLQFVQARCPECEGEAK